jgi:ribosomal protein L7/L12
MYIPVSYLVVGGLLILIIAWLVLRRRDGSRDLVAPPSNLRTASTMTPPPAGSVEAAIHSLIARGKKIEAIKLVRDTWHLGLAEAKDLVEAIEAGAPTALPHVQAPVPAAVAGLEDEIRRLLAANRKIEAIKRAREALGLGLAEAKDYVEAIERT